LGSWCLSAWDVDRGVAARGSRSWKNAVNARPGEAESVAQNDDDECLVLNDVTLAQCILPFILTTIMDPASTYLTLNPLPSAFSGDSPSSSHLGTPRRGASTPVGAPSGSSARRVVGNEALTALPSRIDDDPESIEDRNARLRVGAMGVLKWVFGVFYSQGDGFYLHFDCIVTRHISFDFVPCRTAPRDLVLAGVLDSPASRCSPTIFAYAGITVRIR